MASRFLSAGIRRYASPLFLSPLSHYQPNQLRNFCFTSFVFGARTLCSSEASRASAFPMPFARKFKFSKQSPLPALQNWVDQGNDVSPFQLRSIARTLVKSKRYHHALEVRFSSTIYIILPTCASKLIYLVLIEANFAPTFGIQFSREVINACKDNVCLKLRNCSCKTLMHTSVSCIKMRRRRKSCKKFKLEKDSCYHVNVVGSNKLMIESFTP